MKIHVLPLFCLVSVLSATSGCRTFKVDYNQAYVPAASRSDAAIPGKAIVLAEPDDYNYVYSGRPASFHAGATTLEMPLGKIVCETAVNVMGGAFTEGCVKADRFPRGGRHAAVIQVRASRFKYAFNQIRNLTMAITPQVELAIEVALLDESRSSYFSRVYDSGTVNDKTALDTLRPGETINKLTHKTARELLNRAAADIRSALESRQPAAPAAARMKTAPAPAIDDDGGDSVRERLRKLKKLHEDGLISREVYEERQKKILDGN